MAIEKSPEVLVVGAGPVGLFAALELAQQGIPLRIVDTGVWACKHSYALALHPQSLELLQGTSLGRKMVERAYPVRRIGLYEGERAAGQITLGDPADPLACLAVVRQDFIEEMLTQALEELGVEIEWRRDVSELVPGPEGVIAKIDKLEKESRGYVVAHTEWVVAKSERITVPFVIGADGYNSRVRRTLGLPFPEIAPAAYYAVFECQTDFDFQNEMRILLGGRTTDVIWPLPGGHCRWGFQLPDYADPDAELLKDRLLEAGFGYFPTERHKDRILSAGETHLPVLNESMLQTLLTERAPWFKASIGNITWRTMIRFERRLAPGFGSGRMWLAGDAAHLGGPIGVQSMNLGLFEAHDLAAAVAQSVRGRNGAGLLESFNARWASEWRRLAGSLQTGPETPAAVGRYAGRLLPCLPAHGDSLAGLAAQLGLRLPQ